MQIHQFYHKMAELNFLTPDICIKVTIDIRLIVYKQK